jgi:hypothetical protein
MKLILPSPANVIKNDEAIDGRVHPLAGQGRLAGLAKHSAPRRR